MLLLAHLLTRNAEWRRASIRVMSIASSDLAKTQTERSLTTLLPEVRIDATSRVILKPPDSTVNEVIHRESSGADVVFFGLAMPDPGEEERYAGRLEELAGDLSTVFFVKNSSLFTGELVMPEGEA